MYTLSFEFEGALHACFILVIVVSVILLVFMCTGVVQYHCCSYKSAVGNVKPL